MVDLATLSGPSSVQVVVDKGQKGERGNNILLSRGNPNAPGNLQGTPIEFDLAIDIDNTSLSYLFMYRYMNTEISSDPLIIGLAWEPVLRLIPNSIAINQDVFFQNGSTQVTVQIPIPPGVNLPAVPGVEDIPQILDIQHSVVNKIQETTDVQNPIASNLVIASDEDIVINGDTVTLTITIGGVEILGGTTLPIQGNKTIHLVITVV